MGQTRHIFVYFHSFITCKDKYFTNSTILNAKNVDGVLRSRTRGGRMENVDKSNELWWQPKMFLKQKLGKTFYESQVAYCSSLPTIIST